MSISLCMIARNEDQHIGRCLASVCRYVDEMVVVDTGSADETPQIAQQWGARVYRTTWENDFSKARNLSLDKSGGDWVLFLDCDEELMPGSGEMLRQVVQREEMEAYFALVVNQTGGGGSLEIPSIRLFRNRNCFRFEGKIHEQIVPSIVKHYGREAIEHSEIRIMHHGYNAQMVNMAVKARRNLSILLQYEESEKNGFYYYNLGSEYLRLNQPEQAVINFERAVEETPAHQGYAPMLVKKTITALMVLNRYEEAIRRLKYYQRVYPDYQDLYLWEAICHIRCGRFTSAWLSLQDYTGHSSSGTWYPHEENPFGIPVEQLAGLVDRERMEQNDFRLSVCVVGQDEAEIIAESIKSVNEAAHEVIFLDMQSGDGSADIAGQMGARVVRAVWPPNHAQLLEMVAGQVRGDWVLLLKADEVLPQDSRVKLSQALSSGHELYILPVRTYLTNPPAVDRCEIIGQARLFNVSGGTRAWSGSALEQAPFLDIPIEHRHYQLSAAYIQCRRKRAEERLADWRHDPSVYWDRWGRCHYYSQEYEAAAQAFARSRKINSQPSPAMLYYYGASLCHLSRFSELAVLLEALPQAHTGDRELHYMLALAKRNRGQFQEAEELLQACLAEPAKPGLNRIWRLGTGTFMPLRVLAGLYAEQDEPEKARECLCRAAAFPGAFPVMAEELILWQERLKISWEDWMQSSGLWTLPNLSSMAWACARLGRYQESLAWLEEGVRLLNRKGKGQDSIIPFTEQILLRLIRQMNGD